jgi:hypothetical protein
MLVIASTTASSRADDLPTVPTPSTKPAAASAPAMPTLPPVAAEQVDAAVARAKAFLYQHQSKDGTWEIADTRRWWRDGKARIDGGQWGGATAVATYALLAAGENPGGEKLAPAIAFLKKADIVGTYALAMRCQVWSVLSPNNDIKLRARQDGQALINGVINEGPGRGLYNYVVNPDLYNVPASWDHSCGQIGVLGVWASDGVGAQVSTNPYWQAVDQVWRGQQFTDGAWSYVANNHGAGPWDGPRFSMTAAGVATLYITQEYLHRNEGLDCKGYFSDLAIERGTAWLADHFRDVTTAAQPDCYGLYGIERIGAAGGHKYLGDVDWYRNGAAYLLSKQNRDGSWGKDDQSDTVASFNPMKVPDTCFALIFLCRGRAPVAVNKLQYGVKNTEGNEAVAESAVWQQRPRDVANVIRWIGRQVERDLNWQIVSLSATEDDLHEAPILYISGNGVLDFSDDDCRRLRRYAEEGGLIVGNADCGSKIFADSFQELGGRLFPGREFAELPTNHLIYGNEQFKLAATPHASLHVLGLNNGVRELMLLFPQADAGRAWQLQSVNQRPELFQVMDDVLLYATGKSGLRVKDEVALVRPDPKIKPTATWRVARLQIGPNPDPEPASWRRLTVVMHNDRHVDLSIETVDLSAAGADIDPQCKLAVLTGTGQLALSDTARQAIAKFLAGGGTLLVDAAGGNTEFAASAEHELATMIPNQPMELLPDDHPILSVDGKPVPIAYRPFARAVVGESKSARIKGITVDGRTAMFFSAEDLTAGLGHVNSDGIIGYEPETATKLVEGIVDYAATR